MDTIMLKKIGVIAFWILLALLVIALIITLVIYFYPKKVASLQSANPEKRNYAQSMAAIKTAIDNDKRQSDLNSDCLPIVKSHDEKTTKAVVLLHGISACPDQFNQLGDVFFKAGYNVYIPRVPHHGFNDNTRHADISLDDIGAFLEDTASIASGLGDEVGVVGLSGGANMATWLTQRTDVFSRALLLSPFYEPATRHAPKWQAPFMMTLYGRNILPNDFNGELSVRAVAKYVILRNNYDPHYQAPALKHLAVVTSELDDDIDLTLAHTIPRTLKNANDDVTYQETRLTKDFGVTHDIVHSNAPGMKQNKKQLYKLYFDMYENKQPKEQKPTS